MAGMKRFVTYIYLYEDKKKGNNAGFAKVEIRGGECQIEIHLRGVYTGQGSCNAYLFKKDGEDMVGFPLGELKIMNGNGDFGTMIKAGKIGDSPYGIYEMEGLCLISEDERMFVSRWKEGIALEVSRERFRTWEPKQLEELPESAVATERQSKAETQSSEPQLQSQPQTAAPDSASAASVAASHARSNQYTPAQSQHFQQAAATKAEIQSQPQPCGQPGGQEEMESISAMEIPMRNIFPEYEWSAVWEQLKKEHSVFTPFEDKKILCVQIELKGLRELPKRYWYLGNNSFLLHGFFNYRYIIIGNMEKDRWFIGVPGIYQQQERVMAAIFGFPEFIPAAIAGEKAGGAEPINHFGYWYRFIEE